MLCCFLYKVMREFGTFKKGIQREIVIETPAERGWRLLLNFLLFEEI